MRRTLAFALLAAGCAEAAGAGTTTNEIDAASLVFHPRAELLGERAGWRAGDTTTLEARIARQRAGVDLVNAYWLARLSAMAYRDGATLTGQLAAIGLPTDPAHFQFFTNTCTDAQAFYVTNAPAGYAETLDSSKASPYFAVLAFRGTEPRSLKDIGTDLSIWPTRTTIGNVHSGFARQLGSLWQTPAGTCGVSTPLGPYLRARHAHDATGTRRGAELYFTGHSLGAALANVALTETVTEECDRAGKPLSDPSCFDVYTPVAGVVTFGSPRVGDAAWASWLGAHLDDRTALYRYVDEDDPVPHFPGYPFHHVEAYGSEDVYRAQLNANATIVGVTPPADPPTGAWFGDTISADIVDHGYPAYIAALARAATQ